MLAGVDLADPRTRRYAPVAAVALAALLAVVVPEKTNELVSGTIDAGLAAPTTATTAVPPTSTTLAPAPASAATTRPPSLSAAPRPAISRATPAVSPATPVVTAPPAGVTPAGAATTGPLHVVRHTWAQSATRRGTPLETGPMGQLPVAAFAGGMERASYVELEGGEAELRLAVYTGDDAGDSLPETASVAACPIISAAWEPEDGQSFASAPAHDAARCVLGTRAADGASWSWDLSAFTDRGTSVGFALVPAPGGAGTWHITFAPDA
jgi:hypothetical protein